MLHCLVTLQRTAFAVLAVLVVLAPALAWAEGRVALVVANAAYEAAPLSNPTVDLALVVPALETMGFAVMAVRDADFDTFDSAVTDFVEAARNADIALFYFAGHGFALNDGIIVQNYLMSTSADVTSTSDRQLRRDGLALDEIITLLTASAKTTLIFVDACRNDPRVRSTGAGGGRGLAAISAASEGDVFVGLSTRLGDVAADGAPGQGSPFARAFVANMGTPGLNVPFAFNKVRLAVQAETGRQRPEANRVDLTDPEAVVLVARTVPDAPTPEPVPPEEQARIAWDFVKDSADLAQLERFASLYSGTSFADLATERIESLRPRGPKIDVLPSAHPCDRAIVADSAGITPGGALFQVPHEAITACAAAVAQYPGMHRFEAQLGIAYQLSGNPQQAIDWLEKASADKTLQVASRLGSVFEAAGETQDIGAAIRWYTVAVESENDPMGQFGLARFHYFGTGVPQDYGRARALFAKASEAGLGEASFYLGYMMQNGLGADADPASAADVFLRGAGQGSLDAMMSYASLRFSGTGVAQDFAAAAHWYEQARRKGSPDSAYMLGTLYRDGKGVPQDYLKARALFEEAGSKGHGLALHSLALLHELGLGVTKDGVLAARSFYRALVLGDEFTRAQLTTNSTAYSEATRGELRRLLSQDRFLSGTISTEVFGGDTLRAIESAFGSGRPAG